MPGEQTDQNDRDDRDVVKAGEDPNDLPQAFGREPKQRRDDKRKHCDNDTCNHGNANGLTI